MKFMFFGKLIGGLLGLVVAQIPGLVIGLLVGHAFDRSLGGAMRFGSPENIERIKACFFETSFLLLGFLAKVDGRISQSEIDHMEQVFAQMGLGPAQRQRAIELFHQGTAPGFKLEPVVATFLETCGPQQQLQQTLLLFLISLARADETLEPTEHAALVRITELLGMGAARLEMLLRMSQAQDHFQQGAEASAGAPHNSLEQAYAALGVSPSASTAELKKAYRRRMSEHHPDKLIAKGVPEDMIKVATARSQEVQAAYAQVKKARAAGG